MQVQSIQPTPNPNAYKFVVDGRLLDQGSRHYNNAEEAQGDALATALFAVSGVGTLYFQDDFVTVTTADGADWRKLHEQVKGVLESHYVEDETAAKMARSTAPVQSDAAGTATDDTDMLAAINALLDDRVRPALAGDGGGLEVLSLQNKHLAIRYQGACGSCPSSIAGTLRAIENLLQMEVDEELTVVSG